MNLSDALKLARMLRDGPGAADSGPITLEDALEQVRAARKRTPHVWLTGEHAEAAIREVLQPGELPTHVELVEMTWEGRAYLAVQRVNHREYVVGASRYLCGWDSKRPANPPEGWAPHWFVYDKVPEASKSRR